jgi:cyclophilin family peptidyl-prolyl cis-trans isomerase
MRNRWRATLVPCVLLIPSFCLLVSTILRTPVFARRASAGVPPQAAGSAPQAVVHVRLETTKGDVVIEVTRAWAPHGADRFIDLVRAHYYDDCRLFRVIKDRWAQFGIAGDPAVAQAWRTRTIPDDPFVQQSNVRGTIAFAFAVPNGRTTQVFINTRDNSATHDKEPFVPFGRVIQGLDVADAWYSAYAETSGGGIRAGHQDAAFAGGNAYFDREFPKLDRITRATVLQR